MLLKKTELLAPAGNYDCVLSAVSNGADAVYMGSSTVCNARMGADNFSDQELVRAIEHCRINDVKSYITVNTILSDRELNNLGDYANKLISWGVNAVIVQDIGAATFLHQNFPNLPLHASTQMGICNTDGVRFAQSLGCKRVVLARELSHNEIEAICKNTDVEIEVFVHGALCASCSGYCLMSSFIGRRSGNRGKCAQPCRLLYKTEAEHQSHLMSLKDLMLARHIKQLSQMGVRSLKIEGRMKGPNYVGTVTSIYRKLIDSRAYPSKQDIEMLKTVFNRGGYTDGYFTGKLFDMFAYNKPDDPYKQSNVVNVLKRARNVAIDFKCDIKIGQVLYLKATDQDGNVCEFKGMIPAFLANKSPITKDEVKKRLSKLGETPFYLNNTDIILDECVMLPYSEIASARRSVCEQLIALRRQSPEFEKITDIKEIFNKGVGYKEQVLTAEISTLDQLKVVLEENFSIIYLPFDLMIKNFNAIPDKEKIVCVLPKIIGEDKRHLLNRGVETLKKKGFNKFLVGNVGDIKTDGEIFGDYTLSPYNSATLKVLSELSSVCLSPELNLAQIKDLKTNIPCEAIIYGRIALMFSKNCFVKAKRGKCGDNCFITDRTGAQFPLICSKNFDGVTVLNSIPLFMGNCIDEFKNSCVKYLRLIFTTENKKECKDIISLIKNQKKATFNYTRGHYYRGV